MRVRAVLQQRLCRTYHNSMSCHLASLQAGVANVHQLFASLAEDMSRRCGGDGSSAHRQLRFEMFAWLPPSDANNLGRHERCCHRPAPERMYQTYKRAFKRCAPRSSSPTPTPRRIADRRHFCHLPCNNEKMQPCIIVLFHILRIGSDTAAMSIALPIASFLSSFSNGFPRVTQA